MDWYHVLRSRCPLLLGLDLFRFTYCGKITRSNGETISRQNRVKILSTACIADRIIFYDKLVPSCDSNAILRNEEEGDGENEAGKSQVPLDEYLSVVDE